MSKILARPSFCIAHDWFNRLLEIADLIVALAFLHKKDNRDVYLARSCQR